MDIIRKDAQDPNSPVISWWDMGYYYEYQSQHPAAWDGGSFNSIRSIIIGKMLTSRDAYLSAGLAEMLAHSGNQAINCLSEHLGTARAFDAVFNTVKLDRAGAQKVLKDKYGLSTEAAGEAAGLICPDMEQEIYLVTTGSMMSRLGWFEFYGNWDFTGTMPLPAATRYNISADLKYNIDSEDEDSQSYFKERSGELIWKMYFEQDGQEAFELISDQYDGVERIQVWKVMNQ